MEYAVNNHGGVTNPEKISFNIGKASIVIEYCKLADGLYVNAYSVQTPRCGMGCGIISQGEKYKTLEEALRSALDIIERYCMRNGVRCDGLREKAYGFFSPDLFKEINNPDVTDAGN